MFFFFKQKTAYDVRISDWSSDVCSSDLFPEDLSGAQQVILPLDQAMPAVEAIHTAPDRATAALTALARQGFDLTRQTPLRVSLLRTASDEHLLGVGDRTSVV